jgi:hypothetical protein
MDENVEFIQLSDTEIEEEQQAQEFENMLNALGHLNLQEQIGSESDLKETKPKPKVREEISRALLSNHDILGHIYDQLIEPEYIKNLFLCCRETVSEIPRLTCLELREENSYKLKKLLDHNSGRLKTLIVWIERPRVQSIQIPKTDLCNLEVLEIRNHCIFALMSQKFLDLDDVIKKKDLYELNLFYQPFLDPCYKVNIKGKKIKILLIGIDNNFIFVSREIREKSDVGLSLLCDKDTEIYEIDIEDAHVQILNDSDKIPVENMFFKINDHIHTDVILESQKADDFSFKVEIMKVITDNNFLDINSKICLPRVNEILLFIDEEKLETIDITAFARFNSEVLDLRRFKNLKNLSVRLFVTEEKQKYLFFKEEIKKLYDDYKGTNNLLQVLLADGKKLTFEFC